MYFHARFPDVFRRSLNFGIVLYEHAIVEHRDPPVGFQRSIGIVSRGREYNVVDLPFTRTSGGIYQGRRLLVDRSCLAI